MRNRTWEIYLDLKSKLSNDRSGGMPLPPERVLARQYGVGRSAVRTALQQLELDGLLATDALRGVRLSAGSPGRLKKVYVVQSSLVEFRQGAEGMGLFSNISSEIYNRGGEIIPVFTDYERILNDLLAGYDPEYYSGVIMIESPVCEWLSVLTERGIPVVTANYEGRDALSCTRVDFREIGRLGGRSLVRAGHRRIGLIGKGDQWVDPEMAAGLRGALAEEKVAFNEEFMIGDCYYDRRPEIREQTLFELRRLLTRADRPEAFLVFRSIRLGKLARVCEELGLCIPEDLSVVVYDLPVWCDGHDITPSLVMQPVEALGREAVRLLQEWNLERRAPEALTIPLRFCDRGSVMPPAGLR